MAATADARRCLLEGLVDYAGLFPPAALSMADALRRYDDYRRGAHAWALGKFVLPVARLGELVTAARPLFTPENPWPLAVIAGVNVGADVAAIEDFSRSAGAFACVEAIEVKAASLEDVAAIAKHVDRLRAGCGLSIETYVEVPITSDPSPLIASIGSHGLRAKVRTGGVEAGAFPTAEQVTRFLNACAAYDVTFKATAGLHHAVRGTYPLTYHRESEESVMFGFLNVFLAALFVRDGLGVAETNTLLEERDASAFEFSSAGVTWHGRTVAAAAIQSARICSATSFGSCSFDEPLADLSALGLLA